MSNKLFSTYNPLFLLHIIFINLIITSIFITAETSVSRDELSHVNEEQESHHTSYNKVSEQDKKIFIEHVKKNFLKVLGLNKQPRKRSNKVIVPHEMLKRYKDMRGSLIDAIPDDIDYYGKIYSVDEPKNDIWTKNNNREIEIDLESYKKAATARRSKRFYTSGTADTITCLTPQDEVGEIPERLEHQLPPHSRGKKTKNFMSVHLKFNYSREFFHPAIDELKGAELRLTREKPPRSETDFSQRSSLLMQSSGNDGLLQKSSQDQDNIPSLQTVYILQILDYDKHGEPISRIVDSKHIDTNQTTTLVFDVYSIVKHWFLYPTKNYGLIIRITDDNEIDTSSRFAKNTLNSQFKLPKVVEHVRLRREFGFTSEDTDTWTHKQPMILVHTGDPKLDSEPFESHLVRVKRDQSNTSRDTLSQASTSGTTNQRHAQTNTQGVPVNRQLPAANSRRGNGPRQNSGQTQNHSVANRTNHQNRPKKPKHNRVIEKCSKKSFPINFDEVGWHDWILAPHAYFANFCSGDCSFPLSDYQNATNHAIIQSIYHSVGRNLPKSCCVPTKLGSMSILFSIDGIVQLKNYNDMIVESCGCL